MLNYKTVLLEIYVNIVLKFFVFQSVIVSGFICGYFLHRAAENQSEKIIKKILKFNIVVLEPVIVINATWGIVITKDLIILPIAGLLIVIAGFILGKASAFLLYSDKRQNASFAISSSLANHGFTMGAFICYIFIGQQGLALSFIFTIYFTFYVYIFIFNYASAVRYNHIVNAKFIFKNLFQLQNMPLYSIVLGLLLSVFKIQRPVPMLNFDILLYLIVFLYFLSLGMQFSFRGLKSAVKPSIFLAGIKFIILPALTIFALSFFRLQHEVKAVIIIQSFMPVGVFSVVASSLYDLEKKTASSLFLINTIIYLAVVLPLTFIFKSFIL